MMILQGLVILMKEVGLIHKKINGLVKPMMILKRSRTLSIKEKILL